jgi:hypothetical protein
MLSASAAFDMSVQHKTPEDSALAVITKEISDSIAQASIDGFFHIEYILPVVLSHVPAYDFYLVHRKIISQLLKNGYKTQRNGPQLVISWGKRKDREDDFDDDDAVVHVKYSKNVKKSDTNMIMKRSAKHRSRRYNSAAAARKSNSSK